MSRLPATQLPSPCGILSAAKLAQAFSSEMVPPLLTVKAFG